MHASTHPSTCTTSLTLLQYKLRVAENCREANSILRLDGLRYLSQYHVPVHCCGPAVARRDELFRGGRDSKQVRLFRHKLCLILTSAGFQSPIWKWSDTQIIRKMATRDFVSTSKKGVRRSTLMLQKCTPWPEHWSYTVRLLGLFRTNIS